MRREFASLNGSTGWTKYRFHRFCCWKTTASETVAAQVIPCPVSTFSPPILALLLTQRNSGVWWHGFRSLSPFCTGTAAAINANFIRLRTGCDGCADWYTIDVCCTIKIRIFDENVGMDVGGVHVMKGLVDGVIAPCDREAHLFCRSIHQLCES